MKIRQTVEAECSKVLRYFHAFAQAVLPAWNHLPLHSSLSQALDNVPPLSPTCLPLTIAHSFRVII